MSSMSELICKERLIPCLWMSNPSKIHEKHETSEFHKRVSGSSLFISRWKVYAQFHYQDGEIETYTSNTTVLEGWRFLRFSVEGVC